MDNTKAKCSEISATSAVLGDEKFSESGSFDRKKHAENDLGENRVVTDGPHYPDINSVKPNFWFDIMHAAFCLKYADCVMRAIPGWLPTVEESEGGEVKSVTYTYTSDCWFDEGYVEILPGLSIIETFFFLLHFYLVMMHERSVLIELISKVQNLYIGDYKDSWVKMVSYVCIGRRRHG